MKKNIIIGLFLALAAMAGQAQIVCHIEGEVIGNEYGNDIVICPDGTDLRVNDDPSLHVKAVNGKFSKTIECDFPKRYEIYLLKESEHGGRVGFFFAENATVRVKLYGDESRYHDVESDGEEGRKYQELRELMTNRFYNPITELSNLLHDSERQEEFFTAEFITTMQNLNDALEREYHSGEPNQSHLDSIYRAFHQHYNDPGRFSPAGLELHNKKMALQKESHDFKCQYFAEHPMLEALYETLDAYQMLDERHTVGFVDYDPKPYEQLVALYHDQLVNNYPGHPLHQEIARADAALHLQPGKSYIDYNVRNNDGELVPISSLIKGRVALIDLWASWCGPCRRHSKAMIPIYEKYKDQGFTVVAIARQDNRRDMERAAKQDGYPWESLLELKDENQVWFKNGAGNGGGAMFLIDRDGTILSTSTDAAELEPLIRQALNID